MRALTTASRRRPECRRPMPRKQGWRAALECMEAEDAIVLALCGPGTKVSAVQAATAIELASGEDDGAGQGRCVLVICGPACL
jgi:hypothetical protein